MLIDSNDWFYSNNRAGIDLFSADGTPFGGNVTRRMGLWDAGTEVDEEPGVGPNQAPRQPRPDTGPDEDKAVYAIVAPADNVDGVKGTGGQPWVVPTVEGVIKVTITPRVQSTRR